MLDDKNLKLLLDKVHRNKGVDFSLYRINTIKRRLSARIRKLGLKNILDYLPYLNQDPSEYDRLIEEITINVTEFFRNPEAFEAIAKKVIPEIIRTKETQADKTIRAWSAGSSSGEEAYSLAILFTEALKDKHVAFDVKIHATDIDPDCIRKAEVGIYGPNSLKEVDSKILKHYFDKKDGDYAVSDELKRKVTFKVHNLVSDDYFKHLDIIICRNVLIYFTKPLQEMVYNRFAGALNPSGFLVLGKVESLWGYSQSLFEAFDNRERIYRKR